MHIAGFLRGTGLTFVEKKQEAGDIYTFYFTPKRPLKHIAGQHGLFILPGFKGLHIFSLSSAPEEQYVSFSTHVRQGSAYKQQLATLKAGDHMTLLGPVLDFVFQKDTTEYVFLAQGIGITPFRSLLVHAKHTALPVKTTLIHVDGYAHTFKDETVTLASDAHFPTNPEEFTSAVTTTLNKKALYYLSGSPGFVKATTQTLLSLGIEKAHIKTDKFLGY